MSAQMSHRNWCFTIFDYDATLIDHLTNGLKNVRHCVFQEETAPSTGKKHLQGHVIWKSVKTMSACKKALKSPTCHLEIMRGTPKQSTEYCTKDNTHDSDGVRVEIGECPSGQGSRSDLEECVQRIRSGELSYPDIELYYPQLFVQYRNGLREICDKYRGAARNFKSTVTVHYGKSGTGKSQRAFEDNSDVYVLRCNKSAVWFDGYNYNTTVVIDDFYGWIPFNMLLNLLDRYPMKVDVKGSVMEFNSPNIIITSNKSPLDWYPNLSTEHQIALLRRLDSVLYFDRKGVTDVTTGLQKHLKDLIESTEESDDDFLLNLAREKDTSQIVTTSGSMVTDDNLLDKRDEVDNVAEESFVPKLDNSTEVPPGNTILEDTSNVESNEPEKDTTANDVCPDVCLDVCPDVCLDVCPDVCPITVEWDDLDDAYLDDMGNSYSRDEVSGNPMYVVRAPRVLKRSKRVSCLSRCVSMNPFDVGFA